MAYNDEVGLVDPFDGVNAIRHGIIECVGSAKDRLAEDALRIMRAIRFASQLEFIIMPDVKEEIHRQCENLKNVSIERINSEFCKIVMADGVCNHLALYHDVFFFLLFLN